MWIDETKAVNSYWIIAGFSAKSRTQGWQIARAASVVAHSKVMQAAFILNPIYRELLISKNDSLVKSEGFYRFGSRRKINFQLLNFPEWSPEGSSILTISNECCVIGCYE